MGQESGSGLAGSSGSRALNQGDRLWSPQAPRGAGVAPSSLMWLLQASGLGWCPGGLLAPWASAQGRQCPSEREREKRAEVTVPAEPHHPGNDIPSLLPTSILGRRVPRPSPHTLGTRLHKWGPPGGSRRSWVPPNSMGCKPIVSLLDSPAQEFYFCFLK